MPTNETRLPKPHIFSTTWIRCLDRLTETRAPTSYDDMSKMGLEEAQKSPNTGPALAQPRQPVASRPGLIL